MKSNIYDDLDGIFSNFDHPHLSISLSVTIWIKKILASGNWNSQKSLH